MTHAGEDRDFPQPEQGELLCIRLPGGLGLEMTDSWANRRALMVFLRCLRREAGRPLMTYRAIAKQLGYADRRNVNNFWREFEACGEDLSAYLSRRKKVDDEVVALCEAVWKAHPLWSAVEVHAELVKQVPKQALNLTEANVRTAGHQIGFLGIQQGLRRLLAEGQITYKEPVLMEALFALADAGAKVKADEAGAVDLLPEALEAVRPQGAEQEGEADALGVTAEELEASLLEREASPEALKRLWEGTAGRVMLAFVLYVHGLSLEGIASFFGVHKTTVMRWLEPLSRVNWQRAVARGKRFFSGILAVDEKWIQIEGAWWYLFVAVDCVSGFPLHVELFPSNAKPYCRVFLLQVKALGYRPKTMITDGWEAYVEAIASVFPGAQHLLCRFHALKAAFRRLKEALPDWKARKVWVGQLQGLFHTSSKRTVRRRMKRLEAQAEGTPAAGVIARLGTKLPKLLPAVGSTWRPSTANAAERFFGAFDRFYRLKGPFQSEASARKHIQLFLLGYVFHTFSQAQGESQDLCPLQRAGYRVGHLPFFHMVNRPDPSRIRKRLAQGYARVA